MFILFLVVNLVFYAFVMVRFNTLEKRLIDMNQEIIGGVVRILTYIEPDFNAKKYRKGLKNE